MARSVRDIALTYSLLAGPAGADGFSTSPFKFDGGVGASPGRPPRGAGTPWAASIGSNRGV